jgi:hypothetical protein
MRFTPQSAIDLSTPRKSLSVIGRTGFGLNSGDTSHPKERWSSAGPSSRLTPSRTHWSN